MVGRGRQLGAALQLSDGRFKVAFDDAPIGMAVFGVLGAPTGMMLQVNRELARSTGHLPEQLVDRPLVGLVHPEDRAAMGAEFGRLRDDEPVGMEAERRFLHEQAHIVWMLVRVSVLRDREDRPQYGVAQMLDITARKDVESRLTHLALHDALTGLPNRVLLLDHPAQALARAERTHYVVAVLFLDLNDFKQVNDSLGHGAGDDLLVEVARRLEGCLRLTDTAARLGGDEFVLVYDGLLDAHDADRMAARVVAALEPGIVLADREVRPRVSIGIALSGRPGLIAEELLGEADTAMYAAKRAVVQPMARRP